MESLLRWLAGLNPTSVNLISSLMLGYPKKRGVHSVGMYPRKRINPISQSSPLGKYDGLAWFAQV